jgi:hypothetical protein
VFADVITELGLRVQRVRQYLTEIEEGDSAPGSGKPTAPDLKGLFFVYLYGVYEKALDGAFREAVAGVNAHRLPFNSLRPELLAIALDGRFDSLESAPKSPKRWQRRLELSTAIFGADEVAIPDAGTVPQDGSHMRVQQIRTMWSLFGINAPAVPEPRHVGRIEELVEQRNKIAHGRERPDTVGRNFTVADLETRVNDIEAVCLYVVRTLDTHVSGAANLQR